MSYAFCKRFPPELSEEIFEHILNKALNNRMVDPSAVFIDGTHIKASANKKKYQKQQVKKAAKIYDEQLRQEVNAEQEKLGKKPIEEDYRSTPKHCVTCLAKCRCNANEKGQKVFTTHIWQEYLDIVEQLRKTERGKALKPGRTSAQC